MKSQALKGANPPRRNALGRGLSQLMTKTFSALDEGGEEARPVERLTDVLKEVPVEPPPVPPASRTKSAPSVAPTAGADAEPTEGSLLYLSIDRVTANPHQPRQHFEESEIQELAASIKKSGVLQPIVVRRKKGESSAFEIVAGERRFRAAQRAGLLRIPAILKLLTDKEALELGIIENIQRANLNPMEEARAFHRLQEDFGETQEAIARTVGKDRASIANTMRLLKLPEDIQKLLQDGKLSPGHGRALLMLESAAEQRSLAEQILSQTLSVRNAEQVATATRGETKTKKGKGRASQKSPALLQIEERLRRALGTKVNLALSKDYRGELRISIFSREELDRVLEKIDV